MMLAQATPLPFDTRAAIPIVTGVLVILIGGFIVYRALLLTILRSTPRDSFASRLLRPVLLSFAYGGAILTARIVHAAYPQLLFSEQPDINVLRWADAAVLVVTLVGVIRVGAVAIFDGYLLRVRHVETPSVVRVPVLATLFMIVVFVALVMVQFPVTGFIASSTVLTAVIGLSLKDTIANVFNGLSLYLDRSIQIGDWIEMDGKEGEVREMNWRQIRLRNQAGDSITLPTTAVANGTFINHSRPTRLTARYVHVGVDYPAPPPRVMEVLRRAVSEATLPLKDPPPAVELRSFGDSAVNYEIRFFIDDFPRYKNAETEVNLKIWYHLRRAGFGIPFPTRTLLLERPARTSQAERMVRALAVLRSVDFLAALPDDAQERLASRTEHHDYHSGEAVVTQGEPGDSFFVIEGGTALVKLKESSGSTRTVAELGPGRFFGEISLLTGAPRTATVEAKGDLRVLKISREEFRDVLLHHPAAAGRISEIVAERTAQLRDAVEAYERALAALNVGAEAGSKLSDRLLSGLRRFLGL